MCTSLYSYVASYTKLDIPTYISLIIKLHPSKLSVLITCAHLVRTKQCNALLIFVHVLIDFSIVFQGAYLSNAIYFHVDPCY